MRALKLMGNNIASFAARTNGEIIDSNPCKVFGKKIEWNSLHNKIVQNDNVILTNFGDIHPFRAPLVNPIFKCKNLFLNKCDKNFVYYWLDKKYFPNLVNVYLGSHPCEYNVLYRDLGCNCNVYLHENYRNYGSHRTNIISRKKYNELLNSYEDEEMNLF
jgi:hypothetical protein